MDDRHSVFRVIQLYQTFLCSAINQLERRTKDLSEGETNPEGRLSIYNWGIRSDKLKISEENIKNEQVQKLFYFYFWNKHY